MGYFTTLIKNLLIFFYLPFLLYNLIVYISIFFSNFTLSYLSKFNNYSIYCCIFLAHLIFFNFFLFFKIKVYFNTFLIISSTIFFIITYYGFFIFTVVLALYNYIRIIFIIFFKKISLIFLIIFSLNFLRFFFSEFFKIFFFNFFYRNEPSPYFEIYNFFIIYFEVTLRLILFENYIELDDYFGDLDDSLIFFLFKFQMWDYSLNLELIEFNYHLNEVNSKHCNFSIFYFDEIDRVFNSHFYQFNPFKFVKGKFIFNSILLY